MKKENRGVAVAAPSSSPSDFAISVRSQLSVFEKKNIMHFFIFVSFLLCFQNIAMAVFWSSLLWGDSVERDDAVRPPVM
jgi:hypothetical protein